jgi:hypothetical protein
MNTEGLQQDCSADISRAGGALPPWLGGWLETSKSYSSDICNTEMSSFVIACCISLYEGWGEFVCSMPTTRPETVTFVGLLDNP